MILPLQFDTHVIFIVAVTFCHSNHELQFFQRHATRSQMAHCFLPMFLHGVGLVIAIDLNFFPSANPKA